MPFMEFHLCYEYLHDVLFIRWSKSAICLQEGHKATSGGTDSCQTQVQASGLGVLTVVSVQDYSLQRCDFVVVLCISTLRKDQMP